MSLAERLAELLDYGPLTAEQAIEVQQSLDDYAGRVLIDAIILWALGEQPTQRATT